MAQCIRVTFLSQYQGGAPLVRICDNYTVAGGCPDFTVTVQGSKLLGLRISETPKNGEGNPNFEPGFPTGNPEKMA